MRIVCFFPGQGSQDLSFANAFMDSQYEASCRDMSETFEKWSLAHSSPQFIQPIILQHSLWLWDILKQPLQNHHISLCGHSLGELTAHAISLQWSNQNILAAGQQREQLMTDCSSSDIRVIALLGPMNRFKLTELLKDCDSGPWLMNDNSLEQIVIGGTIESISLFLEKHTDALGIRKAITLPMSVLSHCPALQTIERPFQEYISTIASQEPLFPVRSGVDLELKTSEQACKKAMVSQLTHCVRFRELVDFYTCQEPVDMFIEIGPKTVLSGLIKKMSSIPCYSTNSAGKVNELLSIL